ncbi:MAG: hypothetical protein JNK12_20940 [Acidimicrobiales bacterium]|nr:hypothetical protein [Acidimicrobiales bacterium]
MRLLRLHDHAPDGAHIELHPRLSIVSGLTPAAKERLLAALAALPVGGAGGALDGISGEVEVNGIILDLDAESLALLDLDPRLEMVVRAHDLATCGVDADDRSGAADVPGVPATPELLDAARRAARDSAATHDLLRQSIEALEEEHRRALARRSALALAVADAGGHPDPVPADEGTDHADHVDHLDHVDHDDAEVAPVAEHTVMRASTAVLDSPGPTPEAVAALAAAAARVDRLRTRRDDLLVALEPLDDIDTTAVRAALAEVPSGDAPGEVPDPVARAAADELDAAIGALEAYDAQLEANGHGPLAAYRRLDEAQRRFLAAEAAVRPPVIDPADAEALEAAHDDLLEAELRITAARMPGKKLKERLDEAAAVEAEILARVGFATYTAFVMSTTAPVVSPELRAAHAQAQADWEQADAAFAQSVAAVEQDPQRLPLAAAVDAAQSRGQALVEVFDERDLLAALRAKTMVDQAHEARVAAAAAQVRAALESVGVDFGDLELSAEDIVDVATVWLADMAEATRRRGELEESLHSLEDEIAGAELDLSQLETSAPNRAGDEEVEEREPLTPPVLDEQDEQDEQEADEGPDERPDLSDTSGDDGAGEREGGDEVGDLARLDLELGLAELDAEVRDLAEQVDAQRSLLAAAASALEGARAHLAALEGGAGGEDTGFAVATTFASVDGHGAEVADLGQVEWYLLSRLAAQRSVSYAGSVPLVLDDPFGRVADDDVEYLLERLVRMSDAVQLIFVGDDPRVLRWSSAADDEVSSLTHA